MGRPIAREMLEKACREEKDADVSRRILLALKVRCDGVKARSEVRSRILRRPPGGSELGHRSDYVNHNRQIAI